MKSFLKILATILMFCLSGCGGTKSIETKTTEKKENSLISKSDSVKIVERNKKILDSLKIKVPQSKTGDKAFDEAVNKKLAEILEKLNTSKTSGDNSFKFEYDDFLKEFRAIANVGATENVKNIFNKEIHTIEKLKVEIEKPVKFIPQYVLVAAIFGGCFAFALIAFFAYKIYSFFTRPRIV